MVSRIVMLTSALTSMALLVAACGDDDDDDTTTEQNGEEGATPLQAFFGDLLGPDAEAEAAFEQKFNEIDVVVGQCMRDQGFDYTLMASQIGGQTELAEGEVAEPGGEAVPQNELDSSYGYGISTIGGEPQDNVPIRPDIENVAGLTPEERQAYDLALRGNWDGYDQWVAGDIGGFELVYGAPADAGCFGQAVAQVVTEEAPDDRDEVFDQFPTLVEEGEALEARAMSDPRVIEALTDWSDCVADAGQPGFGSPEEAQQSIRDRFAQLTAGDAAALTQLQTDERELAAADLECQSTVDLEGVQRDVQVEYEQDFVDQNRDELERMRDALAAAQESEEQ